MFFWILIPELGENKIKQLIFNENSNLNFHEIKRFFDILFSNNDYSPNLKEVWFAKCNFGFADSILIP